MISLGLSSTSDAITFDQHWHHLYLTSAGRSFQWCLDQNDHPNRAWYMHKNTQKDAAVDQILNQRCEKYTPLQIIEPMTSKWRQTKSPLQIIELLTEKTWGQGCLMFGLRNIKERIGETPSKTGKYFEWMIKQLSNLAFIGYEEFCRSRRVLSTLGLCG